MESWRESVKEPIGLADSLHGKARALRVIDIATLLNISERQVYNLAAQHRIPNFRIGASIRFDPVVIANWLRQKMNTRSVGLPNEFKRRA